MKHAFITIMFIVCLSGMAQAHWTDGDPYKMHYPQLPDPFGWDIDMTNFVLADDWRCRESGLVEDIHFWYSVEGDGTTGQFPPPQFASVSVSIHSDVPDPNPDDPATFSMPGQLLWERTFTIDASMINGPFTGVQGWDDPTPNSNCRPEDHLLFWQLNITKITEPFMQKQGEIYWLDLNIGPVAGADLLVGWKTTLNPYNDAAVYRTAVGGWAPIAVCTDNMRTDLAFVITPEPATLSLLALGGVIFIRKRMA